MRKLVYILVGGFAFWLPDIILDAFLRKDIDKRIILALLMPASLAIGFWILHFRLFKRTRSFGALHMLAGMFLLGPLLLNIANSFIGGGFSSFERGSDWLWFLLTSFFPPYFLIMAVYDGSAAALIFGSVMLVGLHLYSKRIGENFQ